MPSDESVAQSTSPSRHLYIGRVGEACLTESNCWQTTNSEPQPFEIACASFLVSLSACLYTSWHQGGATGPGANRTSLRANAFLASLESSA